MKRNKWLLIAAGVLIALSVAVLIFMMTRSSAPAELPETSQTETERITDTKKITTTETTQKIPEATEETGPSYPVVELDVPPIERFDTNILLEAEDAVYMGLLAPEDLRPGFSGTGYLAGFCKNQGDKVEATCHIDAAQHYDITISVCADTVVTNALLVNGEEVGKFTIEESGHFVRVTFSGVYLPKGDVTLSVKEIDGYFALDYFEISNFTEMYQMEYKESYALSDRKASNNAKKLMEYLSSNYGSKVLTGQYASGASNTEHELIFHLTGKYPAIRFCDLEGFTKNSTAQKSDAITASQEWYKRGGIVGLMWHWDAPTGVSSVYAGETDFSLMDAVTDKEIAELSQEEIDALYENGDITEECYAILRDIDAVSEELKVLAAQDIPVLWRPLHEASGDWFWWGADGPNAYCWLWDLMYTRMTRYHKLHNLIWVWNGQSADYLVGVNQYDIASLDIYLPEDSSYSSRYEQFVLLSRMTGGQKMLALSETSSIPNMNDMFRDNCIWSFFGLWYGDYLIGEDGKYSEKYTSAEDMVAFYNSEAALTLSDTAEHFLEDVQESEPKETTQTTAAATKKTTETTGTTETTEKTTETGTETATETEEE